MPGCNKVNNNIQLDHHKVIASVFPLSLFLFFNVQVIGKALVLDEIINYIQSLQRQVEVDIFIFLSPFSIFNSDVFF